MKLFFESHTYFYLLFMKNEAVQKQIGPRNKKVCSNRLPQVFCPNWVRRDQVICACFDNFDNFSTSTKNTKNHNLLNVSIPDRQSESARSFIHREAFLRHWSHDQRILGELHPLLDLISLFALEFGSR
jgi:hypothetical protein